MKRFQSSVWVMALMVVLVACAPQAPAPRATTAAVGGGTPAPTAAPSSTSAAAVQQPTVVAPKPATGQATVAPARAGGAPSELVIGSLTEPVTLNALNNIGSHFPTYTPIHLIFDSLTQLRPDGTIAPKLAERWESSADGLTFTFTLRPNAKFHDGQQVTADDVKFTIDTLIDPATKNIDKQGLTKVKQVEVVNPQTVRITLSSIDAIFLAKGGSHGIVPKHLLEGKDPAGNQEFTRSPIGSGPYRLVSNTPGQSIVLEAVPDHYRGTPTVKRVIFKPVTDSNVLLTQIRTGEINSAVVAPKDRLMVSGIAGIQILEAPAARYYAIIPNYERPVLKDRAVREALMHGIDRQVIVDKVLAGFGQVMESNVVPSSWAYDPTLPKRTHDPAKAAALLDAAGWKVGGDGIREKDGQKLSFGIVLSSGEPTLMQALIVAQQNVRDIGIDLKIERVEDTVFYDRQRKGDFDAVSRAWNPVWDPEQRDIFITNNAYGKYSNPRADSLGDAGLATLDREQRTKAYRELQQVLHADVAHLFLYTETELLAVPAGISGVQPHPVNLYWNLNEWK